MKSTSIILLLFINGIKQNDSFILDYTLWKNKGFYALGYEIQNKKNLAIGIRLGYGTVSKNKIGPAYHIGNQFGYSLVNGIYLPYTENTRMELNADDINYIKYYESNLKALYFLAHVKYVFNINKYFKPHLYIMNSIFNIKDRYNITGYRIYDNYENQYNDVYGFFSFGIATGFGCKIHVSQKIYFVSNLGFCYYFPYHYMEDPKFSNRHLSQYDGKSVFENGNAEFNFGIGYSFSK